MRRAWNVRRAGWGPPRRPRGTAAGPRPAAPGAGGPGPGPPAVPPPDPGRSAAWPPAPGVASIPDDCSDNSPPPRSTRTGRCGLPKETGGQEAEPQPAADDG